MSGRRTSLGPTQSQPSYEALSAVRHASVGLSVTVFCSRASESTRVHSLPK